MRIRIIEINKNNIIISFMIKLLNYDIVLYK